MYGSDAVRGDPCRIPGNLLGQENRMTTNYDDAMRRALALAAQGPRIGGNPQVGCVLVDDDGTILAQGWHKGAGTPHAEADALSKISDARGLTAVVTLEPCNHTGRTGPCAQALIAAGVGRVVFAASDPSDDAAGGATTLRAAGIEVISGVLADEATAFQHRWLTSARLGRPYVTAKWAASLDGRAAANDGTSQWITGAQTREFIHRLRADNDLIAVGTGTVIADNPSLTARDAAGELLQNQPLPVVFGSTPVPADAALHQHPRGFVTESGDLAGALTRLFEAGHRSLFIEGGPTLMASFIRAGLVDEYVICMAPMLLGGERTAVGDIGVQTLADARGLSVVSTEIIGSDIVITAREEH